MSKQKRKTMRAAKAQQLGRSAVKNTVKRNLNPYQSGGMDACRIPGFGAGPSSSVLSMSDVRKLCADKAKKTDTLKEFFVSEPSSNYDFTKLAELYHIIKYNNVYYFVNQEELKNKKITSPTVYMLKIYKQIEEKPYNLNPILIKLPPTADNCGYSLKSETFKHYLDPSMMTPRDLKMAIKTDKPSFFGVVKSGASATPVGSQQEHNPFAAAYASGYGASATPSGRPPYAPPPPPARMPKKLTIQDIYNTPEEGVLPSDVAASIIHTYNLDINNDISRYFRIKSVDGDIYMFSEYEIYYLPEGEAPKHVYVPKLYKGQYVLCAVNNEEIIKITLVKQGQLAEDIGDWVLDLTLDTDFEPKQFPMSQVKARIDAISSGTQPQAYEETAEETAEESKPPSRRSSSSRSRSGSTSSTRSRHSPPPAHNNSGVASLPFSSAAFSAAAGKLRPTPQQEPKHGQNLLSQIRNSTGISGLRKTQSKKNPAHRLQGMFETLSSKISQSGQLSDESSGEFGDNTPFSFPQTGKTPSQQNPANSNPPPVGAKPNPPPVAAKPSRPPVGAKPNAPPVAAKPKPQTAPKLVRTEGASGRRTPPHGAAASNSGRRRSPSTMRRQNMGPVAHAASFDNLNKSDLATSRAVTATIESGLQKFPGDILNYGFEFIDKLKNDKNRTSGLSGEALLEKLKALSTFLDITTLSYSIVIIIQQETIHVYINHDGTIYDVENNKQLMESELNSGSVLDYLLLSPKVNIKPVLNGQRSNANIYGFTKTFDDQYGNIKDKISQLEDFNSIIAKAPVIIS